ncbi:MAG: response regulator [Spirochaetales bacterium]|nr:response regulator [Spirochaetales bacterium]
MEPHRKQLKRKIPGVLIVDDLSFMRIAIREILEDEGIPVVGEADNGLNCLRFYYKHPVQLVLLDITMPKMDGIETLKRLKQLDKKADVVMCSAMGEDKYIIKSIQLGAKDFIVKPFKRERIVSAVKRALNQNV